jgi:hypothetical protein
MRLHTIAGLVADCSTPVTQADLDALRATGVKALVRCLAFPHAHEAEPTRDECDLILANGFGLGLYPFWRAAEHSRATGGEDAAFALARAGDVAEPVTPLWHDLECQVTPTADAARAFVDGWCEAIDVSGRTRRAYLADGFTRSGVNLEGCYQDYWRSGWRPVARPGLWLPSSYVAAQRSGEVMIGGTRFDLSDATAMPFAFADAATPPAARLCYDDAWLYLGVRERLCAAADYFFHDGAMGHKERPLAYREYINCGLSPAGYLSGAAVTDISPWATSCGMNVRALMRWAGRTMRTPHNGQGIFDYIELSYQSPAWSFFAPGHTPKPGDIFYVAAGLTSNNNHTGMFKREISPGVWETCEGGGGADGTRCGITTRSLRTGERFDRYRSLIGWWDAERIPGFAPTRDAMSAEETARYAAWEREQADGARLATILHAPLERETMPPPPET